MSLKNHKFIKSHSAENLNST